MTPTCRNCAKPVERVRTQENESLWIHTENQVPECEGQGLVAVPSWNGEWESLEEAVRWMARDEYRKMMVERNRAAFDEFLIPTGPHIAQCGCQMRGRAILAPCERHLEMFNLVDVKMFSMPEPITGPLSRQEGPDEPFCTGEKNCPAKLHANDCPKWTEH